ncbi:phage tail protein [Rodentibacter pneumotropicus]|uniref:phage tail protein n=1 Tax=Rodentibacter pneumotropicus TaxID=758 RepID=UPI000988E4D4|nr:phage tail protein [Rodentibacter pneumotropicus]OOF60857.1 phage tail protein [Rodentibacter pneumotropicus]
MKKPNQLRKILEQSLPDFVDNPDRLQLYTDGGQIIATGSHSFSFEYRYTLNVIVTDYAGDIAALIVPMIAYLRTNQPEIFENPQLRENAFKFQVDYNNNNTADISFEIKLTERVISKKEGDSVQLNYAKEPVLEDPRLVKVYLQTWDNLIFEGKA